MCLNGQLEHSKKESAPLRTEIKTISQGLTPLSLKTPLAGNKTDSVEQRLVSYEFYRLGLERLTARVQGKCGIDVSDIRERGTTEIKGLEEEKRATKDGSV